MERKDYVYDLLYFLFVCMFRITLGIDRLDIDFEIKVPVSIRLRKEHWHYIIEK